MSRFTPNAMAHGVIAGIVSAALLTGPATATESASPIPDLTGQWGRDAVFFEPPSSGPGPVAQTIRRSDGVMDALAAEVGDDTNPILKPEAAEAVRKRGKLALIGTVVPDLHNMCWPEPPPYVLGAHFGVLILQQRDEVTFVYLLHNTVRHVRLNARHPGNPIPSWQGDSVGRYEGDTLVIDTIGIKPGPLSTVDLLGTPQSKALHVVERYRLIDGKAAAEAQQKHGVIVDIPFIFYGRGPLDKDPGKKGLQVEFTVEDPNVFTTPWRGMVTYRRAIGDWPESICAENPRFEGSETGTALKADKPDF